MENIIKPKKHLFICSRYREGGAECCEDKGALDLILKLKKEVVRYGKAQEIFITNSGCLGYCQKGITGVLYPSGEFLFQMDQMSLEQIKEKLELKI